MKLPNIKSHIFENSLLIALSNEWMRVNGNKPLEFEAKIEKNRLVLSASLETLDKTKEVDTNEI